MRLHVPVHDSFGMTEIKRLRPGHRSVSSRIGAQLPSAYLEQLEDIEPDIEVGKLWIEDLEVYIVDVFCDQTGYFGARISDDVQQRHDIRATGQVLEDLDLSLYLLLLHRFQHFDDTWLVVLYVDAFKHLSSVLSAPTPRVTQGPLYPPPNTSPDQLSARFRRYLVSPIGLVGCLFVMNEGG